MIIYRQGEKLCHWILKIVLNVTVLFIGILASVPPVCRDSLTHHLYIPKLYLKSGGIHEIPYIPFSYYPQLLDLLYMVPLYFRNDIFPKYIHFAFAIATAFLIYSYLKSKSDKLAALAGALFFLTIPVVVKLSITVYVDLGLIFFTFASVFYLFKWADSQLKWRYLTISGIFTGLALGTKYNGILTLILLALLLLLLIPDQERKKIRVLLYPLVFAITALVIFSPWMIKNYVWTGSPLYPLYKTGTQAHEEERDDRYATIEEEQGSAINKDRKIQADQNSSMNHFLVRKHVYHEQWWETLSIPVRIFFQGKDDNPALFDGKLNPFLFVIPLSFLILSFFDRKIMDREIKFLIIFSTLYILIVFLQTDMRIRYVAPVIPPLVVVSVAGLCRLKEYLQSRVLSADIRVVGGICLSDLIIGSIFCLILSGHVAYSRALFLQTAPCEYISGKVSRNEYIKRFRPEYELIEYLNRTASQDSKILALFLGNRGYYFDNEVRFSTVFMFNAVKYSVEKTDIADKLKKDGFTHVILGFDLFDNWIKHNLQQEEYIKMRAFFDNQTYLIKQNNSYGLYQLR